MRRTSASVPISSVFIPPPPFHPAFGSDGPASRPPVLCSGPHGLPSPTSLLTSLLIALLFPLVQDYDLAFSRDCRTVPSTPMETAVKVALGVLGEAEVSRPGKEHCESDKPLISPSLPPSSTCTSRTLRR